MVSRLARIRMTAVKTPTMANSLITYVLSTTSRFFAETPKGKEGPEGSSVMHLSP